MDIYTKGLYHYCKTDLEISLDVGLDANENGNMYQNNNRQRSIN